MECPTALHFFCPTPKTERRKFCPEICIAEIWKVAVAIVRYKRYLDYAASVIGIVEVSSHKNALRMFSQVRLGEATIEIFRGISYVVVRVLRTAPLLAYTELFAHAALFLGSLSKVEIHIAVAIVRYKITVFRLRRDCHRDCGDVIAQKRIRMFSQARLGEAKPHGSANNTVQTKRSAVREYCCLNLCLSERGDKEDFRGISYAVIRFSALRHCAAYTELFALAARAVPPALGWLLSEVEISRSY